MEDPFKKQEQLVRIEIATPDDWKAYRDLRIEAINGLDAGKLGFLDGDIKSEIEILKDKWKTEKEWRETLSNHDMFVILLWEDSEVAGMIRATKEGTGDVWYAGSAYVKENSRGQFFVREAFRKIVGEIQKRGGTEILMGVKADNEIMIRLATFFGFKKIEEGSSEEGFYMELDLTKKRDKL